MARDRTVGWSNGRGGCGPGGKTVVSTPPRVPQPGHMLPSGQVSVCWPSQVHWDERRHVLILTGITPAVPARTVLHLAQDWALPAAAVERVSWVKVLDQRISLHGDAGARVVARRLPGEARVRWLVILDQGLDPGNPGVRAELESALTELRAVTGVEDGAGAELGMAQPW